MSQIKKGDFVELEYTGAVKDGSFVFDTTDAEFAKEQGIYDDKTEYGPIVVCIGEGHLLKGLDDQLIGKEPGEYEFDISAEDAFGKNDPKLIQLIPASKFRKDDVKPVPGMRVQVDNMIGTVIRSGGGRVVVNFNHPLAAKDVHYKVKVKGIVEDDIEKIKSVFRLEYGVKVPSVTKEGDVIKIDLKADLPEDLARNITERLIQLIGEKKIEFAKKQEPENEQ